MEQDKKQEVLKEGQEEIDSVMKQFLNGDGSPSPPDLGAMGIMASQFSDFMQMLQQKLESLEYMIWKSVSLTHKNINGKLHKKSLGEILSDFYDIDKEFGQFLDDRINLIRETLSNDEVKDKLFARFDEFLLDTISKLNEGK